MTVELVVRAATGNIRIQAMRHSWHHLRGGSESVIWRAEASYQDEADLPVALGELLNVPDIPRGVRRTRIAVGAPLMQVRTLRDLPPVRPQQLQRLVQLQSSRFFRQNGVPLLTAARWVTAGKQDRVAVAIAVPVSLIDSLAETAEAAGLILESIQPEGFKDLPHLSLRLRRPANAGWAARLPLNRLLPAVLGLWLALGALYAARVTVARRSMERERAALSEAVTAVRAARRELANARTMIGAVETDQAAYARTLLTLAALTDALPDSSYITSFALDDGAGIVSGYARRASAVAASFGRSSAFVEPAIEGQVTREIVEGTQRDRFTLSFRTWQ